MNNLYDCKHVYKVGECQICKLTNKLAEAEKALDLVMHEANMLWCVCDAEEFESRYMARLRKALDVDGAEALANLREGGQR